MLIMHQPTKLKAGLFNFFFFFPRDMTEITIRKNEATIACLEKKTMAGFQFVCTCGPNTRLNFQIEILKIERGIADMPFSPFFVEIT